MTPLYIAHIQVGDHAAWRTNDNISTCLQCLLFQNEVTTIVPAVYGYGAEVSKVGKPFQVLGNLYGQLTGRHNYQCTNLSVNAMGKQAIELPVSVGDTLITLTPLDTPVVERLSNGDLRPLLLGVEGLKLQIGESN